MSVIKEIKAFSESEDHTPVEKAAVLDALQADYSGGGAVADLIAGVIGMALDAIEND